MNQTNYQPLRSAPVTSRVTNQNWGVSGSKSSADNYQSYEISVYKHWYVYRHKPKWFGQFPGDRYLGRLRWVSSHADGKQHHYLGQRGSLDGLRIDAGSEKESDRIAHELLTAYGYLTQHNTGWMRREYSWYLPSKYPQQIRCAACGMTAAEQHRNRHKVYMDLRWPKGLMERGMDDWAAHITTRESVVCGCPHTPRQDVIEHHIKTGEGLTYE